MPGPLAGVRIIEIEGIGPCPFGGMLLADLGAEVVRIGRVRRSALQSGFDVLNRGKLSAVLDLKSELGRNTVLKMLKRADALIEGFRPGVMERLGVGPDAALAANPKLVYGRMTGWGQEGPLAERAGHDINYIALTGALHAIGRKGQPPTVPLNLLGDFGGGGLLLAFGVLAALLESQRSGKGQVVDAAMVDGSAALMTSIYSGLDAGFWSDERGANLLDSGAAFYDVYETKDGKFISIGALEPQFYKTFIEALGIAGEAPPPGAHLVPTAWNDLRPKLTDIFRTKTRDEWGEVLGDLDVCFAPVLSLSETRDHPHHEARESFVDVGGHRQPRPAPRFSRTSPDVPEPCGSYGADTERVLREGGVDEAEIQAILEANAEQR